MGRPRPRRRCVRLLRPRARRIARGPLGRRATATAQATSKAQQVERRIIPRARRKKGRAPVRTRVVNHRGGGCNKNHRVGQPRHGPDPPVPHRHDRTLPSSPAGTRSLAPGPAGTAGDLTGAPAQASASETWDARGGGGGGAATRRSDGGPRRLSPRRGSARRRDERWARGERLFGGTAATSSWVGAAAGAGLRSERSFPVLPREKRSGPPNSWSAACSGAPWAPPLGRTPAPVV